MKKENNPILKAALEYARMGFSVIPVGRDKKPLIKWEKYQKEKASEDQIKKWLEQFPKANIGVITGAISGIVVVDVEKGGDVANLPPTVISRTGGGGWHFFYKHSGQKISNATRIREKTDIRGDGGYAVIPPSIHQSGNKYEWSIPPGSADFVELPLWVVKETSKTGNKKTDWENLLKSKILKGARNSTTTKLAGKLLYHLTPDLWEEAGWPALKNFNKTNCAPSLPEKELKSTWENIKKKEIKNREANKATKSEKVSTGRKSQSTLLVGMIENANGLELFHDELDEPFVRLPIEDHFEIWRCRSKQFKRWMAKLFWTIEAKAPSPDTLNTALNVIEAKACFDEKEYKLFNRVAWHEKAIWYDLSDEKWRAVKITKMGWEIIDNPPILFKRHSHQQIQVEPKKDGDISKFLDFVNVPQKNLQILLLTYLVSCFIPDFPHPVLNIYGSQGSAKSTLCALLRKVIDPSSMELATFSREERELIQKISHHWLICFDNISGIPHWISDALCKAVTGSAFSKRELYTDDEDIIYVFRRCIIINGINLVAAKADLLERSILFELERMAKKERKGEKEILEEFERTKPRILGSIFSAVSKALSIRDNIRIDELPRMADFAIWGSAIAEAIGFSQEEFLDAYLENIGEQNKEVLLESYEASSLMLFMDERDHWKGTPTQLLEELKIIAREKLKLDIEKGKIFAKTSNVLSKKLNLLKPNLEEAGLIMYKGEENKERFIMIKKGTENIVSIDESLPDRKAENNKISIDEIPF